MDENIRSLLLLLDLENAKTPGHKNVNVHEVVPLIEELYKTVEQDLSCFEKTKIFVKVLGACPKNVLMRLERLGLEQLQCQ